MNPGERHHSRLARFAVCIVLGMAVLAACSVRSTHSTEALATASARPRFMAPTDRVLVIAFRDGSCLPVYGNHVMCHLTGEHFDAGDVPSGTGADLAAALVQDLQARDMAVIPYERGLQLLAQTDPVVVDRYEPALAIDLGNRGGATKVIMGVMIRYEERAGSWFGSREPAAVAFSLALVDVETGTVTHKLRFNRRQAPLSTNLLALPTWWQEGFGWWTRRQVADRALNEAADALVGTEGTPTLWTNMPLRPAAHELGESQTRPQSVH